MKKALCFGTVCLCVIAATSSLSFASKKYEDIPADKLFDELSNREGLQKYKLQEHGPSRILIDGKAVDFLPGDKKQLQEHMKAIKVAGCADGCHC